MKHDSEKKVKRKYRCPQVLDYGNFNQITASVAMAGSMDGGTGQTDKTH